MRRRRANSGRGDGFPVGQGAKPVSGIVKRRVGPDEAATGANHKKASAR